MFIDCWITFTILMIVTAKQKQKTSSHTKTSATRKQSTNQNKHKTKTRTVNNQTKNKKIKANTTQIVSGPLLMNLWVFMYEILMSNQKIIKSQVVHYFHCFSWLCFNFHELHCVTNKKQTQVSRTNRKTENTYKTKQQTKTSNKHKIIRSPQLMDLWSRTKINIKSQVVHSFHPLFHTLHYVAWLFTTNKRQYNTTSTAKTKKT